MPRRLRGRLTSRSHEARSERVGRFRSPQARRGAAIATVQAFPSRRERPCREGERRRGLEHGTTTVFPLGFGAYDAHAVGAERKNRECRRVVEAWLALKALHERCKARVSTNTLGNSCLCTLVPEPRMVGADISGVLERHENPDEDAWTNEECVGEGLLNDNRQTFIVEGDCAHRHVFHHRPHRRIVTYAILSCQMLDVGGFLCLVNGICNMRKKLGVLLLSYVRQIVMVGVGKGVLVRGCMEFHDKCADGNLYSRQGVHCHKPKVAVKRIDVPNGGEGSVETVAVGVWKLERNEIASQPVISNGIEYFDQVGLFGDKPARNKQFCQFFVGLWHLVESRVLLHITPPYNKMPAETIGRSLSGGVTGGIIPNILPWRKGERSGVYPFFDRQSASHPDK